MKKVINLVLIFVFLVSFTTNGVNAHGMGGHNMGGSNNSSGAPSDADPESLQTLQEVEAALGDAKQKLAEAGFSLKLLQQIKRLEQRLMDIAIDGEGAKPTKCSSIVDQSVLKTDASIQEITNRICDGTQRLAYRGMCNPFLSNFSECEAKEHGHSGGMMGGDNSSGTDMAKPCLTAEEAQVAISDLQRVRDALTKIQQLDTNADNVPDLCTK